MVDTPPPKRDDIQEGSTSVIRAEKMSYLWDKNVRAAADSLKKAVAPYMPLPSLPAHLITSLPSFLSSILTNSGISRRAFHLPDRCTPFFSTIATHPSLLHHDADSDGTDRLWSVDHLSGQLRVQKSVEMDALPYGMSMYGGEKGMRGACVAGMVGYYWFKHEGMKVRKGEMDGPWRDGWQYEYLRGHVAEWLGVILRCLECHHGESNQSVHNVSVLPLCSSHPILFASHTEGAN